MAIRLPVVPHAGTWIEIFAGTQVVHNTLSFPTRERGLKFFNPFLCPGILPSFPTRERGLKLSQLCIYIRCWQSFPTRERGLKFSVSGKFNYYALSFPTRERGLKSVDESHTS